MQKGNTKQIIKKLVCYLLGLFIVTVGINISKLSGLGISPVSAVPRACELIWDFTLGRTTFLVYIVLILLQLAVLGKKFRVINALGLLLTIVFSTMVDFTGSDPNAFGHLLINFPKPEGYLMRLLYSLVSVVIIGFGVFLYLRPNWVPMPAEGLAQAISTVSGKPFGDCKTFVDTGMILIALVLQLVFLGGFSSFTGDRVVVREGTVIAAVFVGQTVKLFSKSIGGKIDAWLKK